ncbi:hypothetical protein SUDANB6_05759 [Streptomyces sp. enrichment culture]|uniref:hypothetical protein n=1 Tax=Streptomyces sp. enrichment culture TaxID=1795815 RepID=UPI003F55F0DE
MRTVAVAGASPAGPSAARSLRKQGHDGRTGPADVVAVGGCAGWYDPRAGLHRRVEYWAGGRERLDAAIATPSAGGTGNRVCPSRRIPGPTGTAWRSGPPVTRQPPAA